MKTTTILASSLALLPLGANAAVLSQYEFTSGSKASTDTSIYSTASDVATASIGGVGEEYTGDVFRMTSAGTGTDYATSNYIEFSTTITGLGVNETINLTSFAFDYGTSFYSVGTWKVGLFSSVGGITPAGTLLKEETNTANIDLHTLQYDTVAGGYQGLTNDDVVSFRLYFADGTENPGRRHVIDNVTLNGNLVVVPEPSSALLLGVAGVSLILRRRRS